MKLSSIYKPVEKDLAEVVRGLEKQLQTQDKFVSQLGTHILNREGKCLRPVILLLSALAITDDHQKFNHKLISLATAIELIHTATLVHDDVIDEAILRRNKPTLNRRWGDEISILFGDYLHSSAFAILSNLDLPVIFSRLSSVIKIMCEGEIRQIRMCFNHHMTAKQYLAIVYQKTSSLFSFSSESGARLAKASTEDIQSLYGYGLNFGMAFQITDDCIDLIGEEEKAGKSLGSDIKKGKLTLPIIHLLNSLSTKAREESISLLNKGDSSHRVREMAIAEGSIESAMKRAKDYMDKARKKIFGLRESPSKESLLNLTGYVIARV